MAVVSKMSLQQVWALIQTQIRETRKTTHDPFGHWMCSNSTYTHTHKIWDLMPFLLGGPVKPAVFEHQQRRFHSTILPVNKQSRCCAQNPKARTSALASHPIWQSDRTSCSTTLFSLRLTSVTDTVTGWMRTSLGVCFYSNTKPEWLFIFGISFHPPLHIWSLQMLEECVNCHYTSYTHTFKNIRI